MNQLDPNSTTAFIPILMMLIVGIGFAVFTLLASHFLGKRVKDPAKMAAYECGITPVGTAHQRFHTRFYLVAMLFIVFDIEAAFLFPWAVSLFSLGWTAWFAMMIFLVELALGFAYAWKKGALEWE